MELLAQSLVNGTVIGSVYALVALGFAIVFSVMRVTNLAHGELYMMGAFTGWWVMDTLGVSWWVSILFSVAVGTLLAIMMERFYRRLYTEAFWNQILLGFGMMIVIQEIVYYILGTRTVQIPHQFSTVRVLGSVRISDERIIVILGSLIFVTAVFTFFKFHPTGKAMRAAAGNRFGASCCGINVQRMSTYAFIAAGALTGAGSALIGPLYAITPFIGAPMLTMSMLICVIGGLGSIAGAAITGYLIGIVDSLLKTYIALEWSYPVLYTIFFVFLLLRPMGLFGTERNA